MLLGASGVFAMLVESWKVALLMAPVEFALVAPSVVLGFRVGMRVRRTMGMDS
jgi:hypothetical protein